MARAIQPDVDGTLAFVPVASGHSACSCAARRSPQASSASAASDGGNATFRPSWPVTIKTTSIVRSPSRRPNSGEAMAMPCRAATLPGPPPSSGTDGARGSAACSVVGTAAHRRASACVASRYSRSGEICASNS
jgi:hypothetical protein